MVCWSCGMETKERTLTAKEWASREGQSIQEMEWYMDAEMFLDEYPHWEVEGLHQPLILQEMFLQATYLGRKEVECMICQGCWHGLTCLDLQVDISAVQPVGPQTSRDEIRDLYHQVCKLQRLPGSVPCRPKQTSELARDMVCSLKKCLRQKGGKLPRGQGESEPADAWPLWSKTPWRRIQDTSAERPHWGKGGPLKGPSSHHCIGGEVWKAELVHHQRLAGCPHPFPELQPLEEKVLGVEHEVPQGLTRGQPHPFPHAYPSSVGTRDLWGWRGWTTFPRIEPRAPSRAGARCGSFSSGAGQQVKGRQQEWLLPRTPGRGIWKVGNVERMGTWYA